MPNTTAVNSFSDLSLTPRILQTLQKLKFETPTPIQAQAIPHVLEGKDVIGIAQTGTGKTLAFGLPLLEQLLEDERGALILAPTRELALQIDESLQQVARALGIRSVVLIGGAPMGKQISQLRAGPSIIVATPGRLMDHMTQKTLTLGSVGFVVLDEADRMLDMGFEPMLRKILATVPKERQTLLFSATMPPAIETLARTYMQNPIRVEVARAGTTTELVSQELAVVAQEEKLDVLKTLLDQEPNTVLVFARTRHGARKVARSIRGMGHESAELHSDRTLAQRKAALEGFKKGTYRVLVATDIAARGIDVKNIALVVNFDLPDNPEDYVHRIGRTGRAGESGRAITFATAEQGKDVRLIERLISTKIPASSHSRGTLHSYGGPAAAKGRGPRPGGTGRPNGFRGGARPAQGRPGPRQSASR